MGSKITRINNSTHEVSISYNGDSTSFTIPEEHRSTNDLKTAYIRKQLDAWDAKDRTVPPIIVEKEVIKIVVKRPIYLYLAIATQAVMIVALLMRGHL